ncbi:MAG: exonuclease SbcCD subunit D [Oscillospiraceae bacterium]|nr:exonuclease SbcCD subunit D [Oscillospiraceae bacterium]
MRFIHLSDLHIGKRVNEISMIEDQQYILSAIIRIVDEQQPEAVVIAGDVYDKSVPSAEAVTLLDDFLCRLAKRNMPVLIISGNHDSPERLAFGGRLMEGAGIYVSPVYGGKLEPVVLEDAKGEVKFWMLPFVKPSHVKRFFPEQKIESYTDALRVAVSDMGIDVSQRNVLITHQFVTGAETCESEEISVGGTDNVDASVFADFDYVALGHIHGPQNIGSQRIRYCGTPLKYSFSEVKHEKSVTLVELGSKGELEVSTLPLEPKRDLREIKGTYDELTARSFYEGTAVDDYLHVTLTDEDDIPEAVGRLRVIYPNIMKLSYDNARTRSSNVISAVEDVQRKSQLQLFEELYELQNDRAMSEEQRGFVQGLIEEIWEGRK